VRGAARALVHTLLLLTSHFSLLTAQAQSPNAAEFQRLKDSLARSSDTTALRTLLRSSVRDHKSHPTDHSAALRSGLVALRLGELRADSDFSEALSIFREAARRGSDRPEPWYALGLAEQGRSAWEMENRLNLGNRVGMKALERAAAHHHRALTADPGFSPAALALARLTLSLSDTARLARSLPVLRKAAKTGSAGADVVLAYGRVERSAGRLDAAAGAFRRYIELGANHSLGQLELARTLLASGSPEGEIAYYEGASMADAPTASEYRSDLIPLVADSGVAHLRGLTGEPLALALAHFWNNRDHLENGCGSITAGFTTLGFTFRLPSAAASTAGSMPTGRAAWNSTTEASSTSATASPRPGFGHSCSARCPTNPGNTAEQTEICSCTSVAASTAMAEATSATTGWFRASWTSAEQPMHRRTSCCFPGNLCHRHTPAC
jgi:tetratricopeptide (TPR) repeat protein